MVPVPEQVDDLTFSWQSLVDVPVSGHPGAKEKEDDDNDYIVELRLADRRSGRAVGRSERLKIFSRGNYYHKIFANRERPHPQPRDDVLPSAAH